MELVGCGRVGQRRVDLRLEDGERCAQLVAGLVDEAALTLEGGLEAVEGGVQGDGKPGEGVVRPRDGQPPGGIRRRDVFRLSAHPLDRAQGRAGHEPHDRRRDQQRSREGDLELRHERAERVLGVAECRADHRVAARRTGCDLDDEEPRRVEAWWGDVDECRSVHGCEQARRHERCLAHSWGRLGDLAGSSEDLSERLVRVDQPVLPRPPSDAHAWMRRVVDDHLCP